MEDFDAIDGSCDEKWRNCVRVVVVAVSIGDIACERVEVLQKNTVADSCRVVRGKREKKER